MYMPAHATNDRSLCGSPYVPFINTWMAAWNANDAHECPCDIKLRKSSMRISLRSFYQYIDGRLERECGTTIVMQLHLRFNVDSPSHMYQWNSMRNIWSKTSAPEVQGNCISIQWWFHLHPPPKRFFSTARALICFTTEKAVSALLNT